MQLAPIEKTRVWSEKNNNNPASRYRPGNSNKAKNVFQNVDWQYVALPFSVSEYLNSQTWN